MTTSAVLDYKNATPPPPIVETQLIKLELALTLNVTEPNVLT